MGPGLGLGSVYAKNGVALKGSNTVAQIHRIILSLLLMLLSPLPQLEAKTGPSLNLPQRPPNALTGSQFLARIQKLNGAKRERAMLTEILRGNVPSHVRNLVPIEKRIRKGPFQGKLLRYWVLPDYLAVGSDRDFVRVPLNLLTVKKLSKRLDLSLPTTKMVDDIYAKARVKLRPRPLPPRRNVSSTRNIVALHLESWSQDIRKISSSPSVSSESPRPSPSMAGISAPVARSNPFQRCTVPTMLTTVTESDSLRIPSTSVATLSPFERP
jgi:hypothetical protein